MKKDLRQYFFASIPVAVAGVWNLGDRIQREAADADRTTEIWQFGLLNFQQISPGTAYDPLLSLALGASFFLPLLLAAVLTSRAWAEVFSRMRGTPLDSGWFLSAWIYTLLLPATLPLHHAAVGFSFGALFGCYVFGGSGRYIVNPSLLGVAFLSISHPELFARNEWLPGSDALSSWALVAFDGVDTAVAGGMSWGALFLGSETGALGTSSALAAMLGAGYLVSRKLASAQLVAASLIGTLVAGELIGEIPGFWHLALGNFAFVLAFIATDRATRPATRIGDWAFGILFGFLIVVLRIADPSHPESAVPALLLATLCIPLFDYVATAITSVNVSRTVPGRE